MKLLPASFAFASRSSSESHSSYSQTPQSHSLCCHSRAGRASVASTLALGLALGLVACSSDSDDAGSSSPTTGQGTPTNGLPGNPATGPDGTGIVTPGTTPQQPGVDVGTPGAGPGVPGQTDPVGGGPTPGAGGATSPGVAPGNMPGGEPGAPGTTPVGSGGTEAAPVDITVIDDFEDMDGLLAEDRGRVGFWLTTNDGTGSQTPAPDTAITPVAGGANGTAFALHTTGSGFSDWGAALQVDMNNEAGRLPYDASAYTGIEFYARGEGTIRVEFVATSTVTAAQGGNCTGDCFDSHGVLVELTPEWTKQTIYFDHAMQVGWGTPADFNGGDLLALSFRAGLFEAGQTEASFDLWIDELKFVGGAAPEIPEEVRDPLPEPVVGQCQASFGTNYEGNNGSVTWYTFDQGSEEVNCSYRITGRNPDTVAHIHTGNGRYFGAMNTADYDDAAVCGACVEVTRDGGRRVEITIVDQCPIGTNPKCTRGHIDLSREAFTQVGDIGEGYLGTGNGGSYGSISWKYVPCSGDPVVSFRLKDPANMNWNEVLVQGHPYPIESVSINGQNATRKDYNFWEPPNGDMGPEPFHVVVTDVNGSTMTGELLRVDGDQDGTGQFTCQ